MKISRFTKALVVVNCTVPALLLGWDALHGDLGANPVNFAIRTTGLLSLIFLVLSLAITPLARLADWSWLGQFRRVLGLYAFFHAALHFLLFFAFDRAAKVGDTLHEITMRTYLMVGIVGLLVMVPLAATSTDRMIRKLGPKRWKLLHRLAYVAAIAGSLHFFMLVKADTTRPVVFASILAVLFSYRLLAHYLQLRSDSAKYRMAPLPATATGRQKQWAGQLKVARMFAETHEVRTFRLVAQEGTKLPFDYLPGQYLNLTLEIDGKKVKRSYTIASSPTRNGYCELSIKREETGLASRFMHDNMREGSLLSISAPAGKFTFTGMEADKIVLIAGGVGITPLMSKIRYLTDLAWNGSIHLLFTVRTEKDIIFRRELEELQSRFPNLKVTITLTRDAATTWPGERGRISREMIERVVPEVKASRVHLCGPTEMTDPIIATLRQMGVPEGMIAVESFASPSRAGAQAGVEPGAEPAMVEGDVDTGGGTLEFAVSGKSVAEPMGRTILELAEEQGIDIPYDCRSGICGQCKTRLLSGTVAMDSEDALDPVDRRNGVILACQARCRDDVVVEA